MSLSFAKLPLGGGGAEWTRVGKNDHGETQSKGSRSPGERRSKTRPQRRGNIPASPRRGGERLDVKGKGEGVTDVSTAKHSAEPPRTLKRRGCLTEYRESLLNMLDFDVGHMWRAFPSIPKRSMPP